MERLRGGARYTEGTYTCRYRYERDDGAALSPLRWLREKKGKTADRFGPRVVTVTDDPTGETDGPERVFREIEMDSLVPFGRVFPYRA